MHSNQGQNFESHLFKEVLKLLQVKKTRTAAYRLSSNGLNEHFNGTLGRMVKEKFQPAQPGLGSAYTAISGRLSYKSSSSHRVQSQLFDIWKSELAQ